MSVRVAKKMANFLAMVQGTPVSKTTSLFKLDPYFYVFDSHAPSGIWDRFNTLDATLVKLRQMLDRDPTAKSEVVTFIFINEEISENCFFFSSSEST